MIGLFSRARPRREAPAPDESRMTMAEVEALLREIAADRPNRGVAADVEQHRLRRASEAADRAPKLAS